MLVKRSSLRHYLFAAAGAFLLTLPLLGIPPAVCTAAATPPLPPAAFRAAISPIQWTDLAGVSYGAADLARSRATVFFWASTQCPLAARYTPRVLALAKRYQADNIACFLVDSNAADSREAITTFATTHLYPFPCVRDEGAVLADRLGATTTPEAVVVDARGRIVYLGRIDDNADHEKVVCRDLGAALNALIADRPIAHSRTRAFGCAITRAEPFTIAAATAQAKNAAAPGHAASPLTYARDIAPILAANCVTCHSAGDAAAAPFALDTYAQAKLWSAAIKDYTTRRQMPPWKALPDFGGPYHDSRYLADADVATLARWADADAPRGAVPLGTAPPTVDVAAAASLLDTAVAWPLGVPDLIVTPPRPFHLSAEGRDVYRDFALPTDFDADRYVSAFDFHAGSHLAVHHIVVYIDPNGESARLEGSGGSTEPGWSVTGGGSGLPGGIWGDVWTPGMIARRLPEGVAIRIPRGARLVLQVHYHKTGKPETDQSALALYYLKTPVQRALRTVPVANTTFSLTAGTADQSVVAEDVLPCDVTLYQIFPHMHMLGTEMKVTAILPDGTEKPLVYVKHWDFTWQMTYRYREPVRLPRGTRVRMVALFDNTVGNPNQPANPPHRVRVGDQLTDEMCSVFLGVTRDDEVSPQTGDGLESLSETVGIVP